MLYRIPPGSMRGCVSILLAVLPLVLGLTFGDPGLATASEPEARPAPWQVVLLNGGGQPAINFFSHLQHVRQFSDLLRRRGLAVADITIFNADGADPAADFAVRALQPEVDFWLLRGTRLERPLRTQVRHENSTVDGFNLRPATRAALHAWFTDAAQHLRPGKSLTGFNL